jgi:hypothetical protein
VARAEEPPLNDVHTPEPLKAHRGVILLLFGLVSLPPSPCFIFGIGAWAMGTGDLKAMAAGKMDPRGERMTRAGRILGIIGVLFNVLWISKRIFIDGVGAVGPMGPH